MTRTIIIGLGNPILGDDAIGCSIADELKQRLTAGDITSGQHEIEIEPFYRGGISLMEILIGYDRAIIIDAIQGLGGKPGTLHHISLDELPTVYANSIHDTSLKAALELGKQLGANLPDSISIIGIEISNQIDFSEALSPAVAGSIEPAISLILEELNLS